MKVLKAAKKTLEAILITAAIAPNLAAQNIVDLHVESDPKYSRVTFTNLDNSQIFEAYTDSLTGNVQFNIPNGNFERKIETVGSYLFKDTVNVNANTNMFVDMIKDEPITSTYLKNF